MTAGGVEPWVGVQSVAYAGLDALLAVQDLDLCAYLHVGAELGPQLYLRRPTLADLDPAEAFRLFSALRDLLDGDGQSRVEVEGFHTVVMASSGIASRGLWVVGRSDVPLDERAKASVHVLGRAVMQLCHEAERTSGAAEAPTVARVAIETANDELRAEVVIVTGAGERTGRGEAAAAFDAVAWATIAATDASLKLVAAADDSIGGTRVVLVLLHDSQGRTAVGAAEIGNDPLQATATATLVAVAQLVRF